MRRLPAFLTVLVLLSAATPGHAVDGVLEINQACAVNTGCFPGDAPGFPVTISTAGSYRLTGSLDATGVSPSVIETTATNVTLDLNGFEVVGGATSSPEAIITATVVRNGNVRGGGAARAIQAERVEHVNVSGNFEGSIYLAPPREAASSKLAS